MVRVSVEKTFSEFLDNEAEKLTNAACYERTDARQVFRSGHYKRGLLTTYPLLIIWF
ncbi:transposase [Ruminiclostridium herbifermentans]|uniref:Transposase n=1 Tax=Ruminiclostridium herbifermentans TaxID=2488810 RepID=A0A4U7JF02_9FIRM|nr:transposase [Ruminiclostridium herbifermentans]